MKSVGSHSTSGREKEGIEEGWAMGRSPDQIPQLLHEGLIHNPELLKEEEVDEFIHSLRGSLIISESDICFNSQSTTMTSVSAAGK